MLVRRSAFEEVGRFDEGFWLYAEELDLCTRLRDAGWTVLFTPELEILHEGGVSTGRSRRMHVMHSMSVYRYYRKHRAARLAPRDPAAAWLALRARAELVALQGPAGGTMKAVVLVGGEGTRLRPLTETMPKPLVPLMDRASLDHVLDHLARHGVHEVVLSSSVPRGDVPRVHRRAPRRPLDHVDHRDGAARDGRRDRERARRPSVRTSRSSR